jgi:hypothetical protein
VSMCFALPPGGKAMAICSLEKSISIRHRVQIGSRENDFNSSAESSSTRFHERQRDPSPQLGFHGSCGQYLLPNRRSRRMAIFTKHAGGACAYLCRQRAVCFYPLSACAFSSEPPGGLWSCLLVGYLQATTHTREAQLLCSIVTFGPACRVRAEGAGRLHGCAGGVRQFSK